MKPLRPYLYHAYYQWIVDNDHKPYLAVNATYPNVDVPQEYVNEEGKITLNLSPHSIGQYHVDEEAISFNARFNGMIREIYLPFGSLEAIYAIEAVEGSIMGGTVFNEEEHYSEENYLSRLQAQMPDSSTPKILKKRKGHLKLVK